MQEYKSMRKRLAEWSKTPEGRVAYEKVAEEMRNEIAITNNPEESEKPINLDDAMKELDEKIALVKQRGTWDGVDVDKYMDEVRGREPEKPMNQEGLEEEINRLWESFADEMEGPHNLFDIYARLARHFAEWGYLRAAEKYNEIEYNRQRAEESVLNDLEEAADEFARFYDQGTCDGIAQDCFIAGAEWDRSQMMKEAVEGVVMDFSSNQPRPQVDVLLDAHKYHTGDRVRIIVIPNTDKK